MTHDIFFGREKENLVFPIALANLVLHGIDQPNLWHGNTLTKRATYSALFDKAPRVFDVILTNPPFGGKEGKDAQKNYAYATGSTQVLFVQDILDDIAYVTKDQAETSVLFELIAARYERRSMLITANQPFGEWGKIFPDQAMTLAAIDRLVHHATILEMNVESYRRREALDRKRSRGRPPTHATTKETENAED